eukprot:15450068-Alexandrium_andersonii.AAC.1
MTLPSNGLGRPPMALASRVAVARRLLRVLPTLRFRMKYGPRDHQAARAPCQVCRSSSPF